MPLTDILCIMGGCERTAVYRESNTMNLCEVHAKERMRCVSSQSSLDGTCLFCGASSGQECMKK